MARHRSFRKAGGELTLSTSAVSYAIRALEERLGVGLFHRTTRSVALTEAGQRLLERLQPALARDLMRAQFPATPEMQAPPEGTAWVAREALRRRAQPSAMLKQGTTPQ